MKPQIPAQGILIHHDYGDAKSYSIHCDCGCDDCSHSLWIEADVAGVQVTINSMVKTDFWTEDIKPRYDIENDLAQWYNWFWTGMWNGLCTRLRLTKDIWLYGYAKHEASLIMDAQQALNYAEALRNAVEDVSNFRKQK